MTGETDLQAMLATLEATCDGVDYGFAALPAGAPSPAGIDAYALIREAEGLTVIAPSSNLANAGIEHRPGWSKLTLTVHSALGAVGLTAAFSAALTEAGISANVVAGYYHDHILVQADRREDALAALADLRRSAADAHAPTD